MTAENPSVRPSVRDSRTFLRSSAVVQPRPPSATAINSEKPPSRTLIWAIHHRAAGAPSHLQGQSHQPGPLSLPGGGGFKMFTQGVQHTAETAESPVSDPCPWTRSHEVFGHQLIWTDRPPSRSVQAGERRRRRRPSTHRKQLQRPQRVGVGTLAPTRARLCGGFVPTQQRPRR